MGDVVMNSALLERCEARAGPHSDLTTRNGGSCSPHIGSTKVLRYASACALALFVVVLVSKPNFSRESRPHEHKAGSARRFLNDDYPEFAQHQKKFGTFSDEVEDFGGAIDDLVCTQYHGVDHPNKKGCCPTECGDRYCGTSDCYLGPGGADACCESHMPNKWCGPNQFAPCIVSAERLSQYFDDESCEVHGGIDNRDQTACCPPLCGEFCGADYCADGPGGAEACCTMRYKQTCGNGVKAPCSISLDIEVPVISYPNVPKSIIPGSAVKLLPQIVYGRETVFTIEPALPQGLQLDSANGVISGNIPPGMPANMQKYVIRAKNPAGEGRAEIILNILGNQADSATTSPAVDIGDFNDMLNQAFGELDDGGELDDEIDEEPETTTIATTTAKLETTMTTTKAKSTTPEETTIATTTEVKILTKEEPTTTTIKTTTTTEEETTSSTTTEAKTTTIRQTTSMSTSKATTTTKEQTTSASTSKATTTTTKDQTTSASTSKATTTTKEQTTSASTSKAETTTEEEHTTTTTEASTTTTEEETTSATTTKATTTATTTIATTSKPTTTTIATTSKAKITQLQTATAKVLTTIPTTTTSTTTLEPLGSLTYKQVLGHGTSGDAVTLEPHYTGHIDKFTISPALPNGFTLNSTTGTIKGVLGNAEKCSPVNQYRVQAEGKAGITHAIVTLLASSNSSPKELHYSGVGASYRPGETVTFSPEFSGGKPTKYTITPALPTGLKLNALTGQITGVVQNGQHSYVIEARNQCGATSAPVKFDVRTKLAGLSYLGMPSAFTSGMRVTLTPNVSGHPRSYSISPDLPTGLALDSFTGRIEGTLEYETSPSKKQTYVITARTSREEVHTDIKLPKALVFHYSGVPDEFVVGDMVRLSPTYTGALPANFSIQPPLPEGIWLAPTTGELRGKIDKHLLGERQKYVVTVSSASGRMTSLVFISVPNAAPNNWRVPETLALLLIAFCVVLACCAAARKKKEPEKATYVALNQVSEQPYEEADPAVPDNTVTPTVERMPITFVTKGGERVVYATHKPLGLVFQKGRLPVKITNVIESHGKDIGVQVGWTLKSINNREVTGLANFEDVSHVMHEEICKLPGGAALTWDVGNGKEKTVWAMKKPLGLVFDRVLPIKITKEKPGHGYDIGIRKGWTLKRVNYIDLTRKKTFQEADDILLDEIDKMIDPGHRLMP